MAIQIRRGLSADLVTNKLLPGEFAVATDTGKLLHCYSAGNVKELATIEDVQNLLNTSPETYAALQQLIADLELNPSELTNILNNISNLQNTVSTLATEATNTVAYLKNEYGIFNSGTGKDSSNVDQNYNTIADGQSNVILKGSTDINLANNGDYPTDTTGFTAAGGTLSISSGSLVITGDGTTTYPSAYGTGVNKNIRGVTGKKVFVKARLKSMNSLAQSLVLKIGNVMASTQLVSAVYGPANGIEYVVSGIVTLGSALNGVMCNVIIESNYASTPNANGASIKCDDLLIIDLSAAYGVGYEPTLDYCNKRYDHYFDKLQGVGNEKIISIGKNIFSGWEQGGINYTSGAAESATNKIRSKDFIRVKANTAYVGSDPEQQGTALRNLQYLFEYDANKNFIKYATLNQSNITFTTAPATAYIKFLSQTTGTFVLGDYANYKTQVEEGSTATAYEQYKSSSVSITSPVKRHGFNGISDTVEDINGIDTLTQRLKEYALVASDITAITTGTNLQYVTIPLSKLTGIKGQTASTLDNNVIVQGFYEVALLDQSGQANSFITDATNLYAQFALGTYANSAAAQTALTGTKLVYHLSTPITYVNGTSGFEVTGNLEIYPNGTVYQEASTPKESANASIGITYNLSDKAVLMDNSSSITKVFKSKIDKAKIIGDINSAIDAEQVTGALGLKNAFGASKTNPGYTKLPNGLVFIWGTATYTASAAYIDVTLPIAITTALFSIANSGYRNSLTNLFSSSVTSTTNLKVYGVKSTTGSTITTEETINYFVIGIV